MIDVVSQWIGSYGYVLVALFLFIEALGVPIPGETALVTAAALAGRGTLSIGGVMLAAFIGTVSGGHAGYWIGMRGGRALLTRHGRWVGLTEARLDKTQKFFDHHGAKTVLMGRFVAVVRSFIGILAGLTSMPIRTFAAYNAAGGAIWAATFATLGYLFGRNLPKLVHYIGRVSLVVALLIAIIASVIFLSRWFAKNRATLPVMTWDHRGYLAIHLAVGFGVSLAVIAIFASISEGVVDTSPLTRFDIAIASRLQASAPKSMLELFAFVSSLGGRGAMTALLIVGAVIFALRRKRLALGGWTAAFIGGALLDAALRFVVRRSELPFAELVVLDWGVGLASGHALGVLVGYGMLAWGLISVTRGAALRTIIIVLATAMVIAIVISRLYLGQAYVSDAAAGLAAGFVWLATCVSGIEVARQRRDIARRAAAQGS
jgi:undecaprenyl-diphosphatase